MIDNYIIIGVILLILGLAGWYLIRAKRKGSKCAGCPYACGCEKSGCNEQ